VDGGMFTGADAPPDQFQKATGVCVLLSMEDADQADRVFNAMTDGGKVQMPIQETFWAKRFGMFIDRFGIPWMINCSKPM
jgi:PhnB protein